MDYGQCGSRRASWRRGLIELNLESIDWERHSGGRISMCKGSEHATHNLLEIKGGFQSPPAFGRRLGEARTNGGSHLCVSR